jgi:hypothetical protein
MTATPQWAFARIAFLAPLVSFAPLAAMAQEAAPGQGQAVQSGISIRANIDLVFQPAFRDKVTLMQKSFAAGAMGPNATSEYVFGVLNEAALAGLNEALAQGARTGRITVVATGCHVGVSPGGLDAATPAGIFINTTDMEVGDDGIAHFRTRVKFIPDYAVAPGAVTDPETLPDPDRVSPKF